MQEIVDEISKGISNEDFEISLERVEEALDIPVLAVVPYELVQPGLMHGQVAAEQDDLDPGLDALPGQKIDIATEFDAVSTFQGKPVKAPILKR